MTDELIISVEEIKKWIRVDIDDDNDLIHSLILSATNAVETYTGRNIAQRTIELPLNAKSHTTNINIAPIVDIVKLETISRKGIRTTLSPDSYYLTIYGEHGVLYTETMDKLCATLRVGYDNVPAPIKQAIAVHVADAYQNREGQTDLPNAFKALLSPYRLGFLA